MPALTYLEFLFVFIIPPIILLGAAAVYRDDAWFNWRSLSGIAIIIVLAVVYTTPWDNLLIAEGVWWYGDGTTVVHFWEAPLGEYLFFVLQPILTGLWLFQFPKIADVSLRIPVRTRLVGIAGGAVVSLVGYALLASQSTFYLGAILFWAGPILAIQWGFGWPYLLEIRRTVAVAVLVPTLYLWVVDRIAIGMGIWVISETHTVGYGIFGLPIEEALFFLVTNIFTIQGLVFYVWLLDRVERGELADLTITVRERLPGLERRQLPEE